MVAMSDLQDLMVDQLKDLYNAESQLVKALGKMAKKASHPELKAAFEEHLEQTEGHINRLEQVFESLGEKAKGKTCHAMKGLVEEAQEAISEIDDPEVLDAALIAAAQRVEHYEMAGYGTVRTYAEMLGNQEAARLLQETLDEEGETDKKLTALAVSAINIDAQEGEDAEDEGEAMSSSRSKGKGRSR